ncbi:MAG: amidohydrolase family protein [Defluviitaleaceae bacterium]|nr:amidohydrolase family protein [Defluviitaleaceae bacterium]
MRRGISPSQVVVFMIMVIALLGVTAYAVHLIWSNMDRDANTAGEGNPVVQATAPPPVDNNDPTENNATTDNTVGNAHIPDPEYKVPLPAIPLRDAPPLDTTMYDAVILNARLINPETLNDMEGYNIGILNGRIATLTRRPIQGRQVIDATGLIAAPGFIDIVSFRPTPRGAELKIMDGVTTNMQMHGGAINAVGDFGHFINNPPIINFGMSNFVAEIRGISGYGPTAVMTSQASINTLINHVRRNIENGSVGISVIPEYTPGVQGAELLALAHLAAEMDVPMHWHIRYATPHGERNSLVAIQEVIDLARITGAAMHIMHINSTGATHVAQQAFAMLRDARDEGLVITACVYPYTFWGTNVRSERFAPGWQTRFGITYNDLQIPNSDRRLTATSFAHYRSVGQLVFALNTMPEDELRYALQQDFMMIGSDTMFVGYTQSHPRGAGTFSRVIGHYARDEGVITLMEALTMMTIRPAQHLSRASYDADRKGRLEIGADADIVLFCFDTIIDTATPERVGSPSIGVQYVFVNGQLQLSRAAIVPNVRAGLPLRSRFISPQNQLVANYNQLIYTPRDENTASTFMRDVPTFTLFNLPFVDLREIAQWLEVEYHLAENGAITIGQARLQLGETAFESYAQHTHLHHEPVIFRGSVFVPMYDLPALLYGITIG